jgi:hypothetical protein
MAILRFDAISAKTPGISAWSDDDVHHHAAHRAQELQEYWRIFDRNLISQKLHCAFIVDAEIAPTKLL